MFDELLILRRAPPASEPNVVHAANLHDEDDGAAAADASSAHVRHMVFPQSAALSRSAETYSFVRTLASGERQYGHCSVRPVGGGVRWHASSQAGALACARLSASLRGGAHCACGDAAQAQEAVCLLSKHPWFERLAPLLRQLTLQRQCVGTRLGDFEALVALVRCAQCALHEADPCTELTARSPPPSPPPPLGRSACGRRCCTRVPTRRLTTEGKTAGGRGSLG